MNTSLAALRNSAENSSSAAAAARAARARSSAICSSRFARPRLIAASLRASGVMPLRGGDDASMASRRRQKNGMKPWRTPRDAPLVDVDFARPVGVQGLERLLEARRVQQEHQVLLAARLEERYHFLIRLYGLDDLIVAQGPAAVLVDELEAAPGRRLELRGEFLDFLLRGLGLQLAPRRALGQLVRQRRLDTGLPA